MAQICPGECPPIIGICDSLRWLWFLENIVNPKLKACTKQMDDFYDEVRKHLTNHQVDLSQDTAKILGQYRAKLELQMQSDPTISYRWLFAAGTPISWWLSALTRQVAKKLFMLHQRDDNKNTKTEEIRQLFQEIQPYLKQLVLSMGKNHAMIPQGVRFLEIMIYILRGDSPSDLRHLVERLHPENEAKAALQLWLRQPQLGLPSCLAILQSISRQ